MSFSNTKKQISTKKFQLLAALLVPKALYQWYFIISWLWNQRLYFQKV